jgi:glucoamylase
VLVQVLWSLLLRSQTLTVSDLYHLISSVSDFNEDFYTWTRDSALVFKALVDQLIAGNKSLEPLIQQYISAQANLQTVNNPSGGLCSGGLAEPKFEVNLQPFTGAWGRPQRDGPALRATAMIAYSRYLIVSDLYPILS